MKTETPVLDRPESTTGGASDADWRAANDQSSPTDSPPEPRRRGRPPKVRAEPEVGDVPDGAPVTVTMAPERPGNLVPNAPVVVPAAPFVPPVAKPIDAKHYGGRKPKIGDIVHFYMGITATDLQISPAMLMVEYQGKWHINLWGLGYGPLHEMNVPFSEKPCRGCWSWPE